jgi:hypothetical protein
MPEICRFFGIVIRMFYDDHNPPHFHAEYGDDEAWINITTLAVFQGHLSARTLGMVIEWASMHQDELRRDWELARQQQKPDKIQPLR